MKSIKVLREERENFSKAVKEARKRISLHFNGYSIFASIVIKGYDLNPYRINLQKLEYQGKAYNCITGKRKEIDLRKLIGEYKK